MQWDPDHDPYGMPTERRAIQLGLKGEVLYQFCTQWLGQIQDITDWVKLEGEKVFHHQIDNLLVACEDVFPIQNPHIIQQIGIKAQINQA